MPQTRTEVPEPPLTEPFRPYSRMSRAMLILVAAISFGLGISLPLVQFEKLYFFKETPSLLGVIGGLWETSEIALAIVVTLFSILLPAVKMAVTQHAILVERKPHGWASLLAKWSLMDVLLVAILIFAAKTSGLATAITQPGVWFFGLSAIATAAASHVLKE